MMDVRNVHASSKWLQGRPAQLLEKHHLFQTSGSRRVTPAVQTTTSLRCTAHRTQAQPHAARRGDIH
jgi:hypothetical protein